MSKITNADEYQKLAMRTNDKWDYQKMLINGALGLNGEAGEIADTIKKWQFQGHALNPDEVMKEVGDVLWYCALMATALNFKLSEVMEANIEKLKKRYPNGFDDERSVNRVDK